MYQYLKILISYITKNLITNEIFSYQYMFYIYGTSQLRCSI